MPHDERGHRFPAPGRLRRWFRQRPDHGTKTERRSIHTEWAFSIPPEQRKHPRCSTAPSYIVQAEDRGLSATFPDKPHPRNIIYGCLPFPPASVRLPPLSDWNAWCGKRIPVWFRERRRVQARSSWKRCRRIRMPAVRPRDEPAWVLPPYLERSTKSCGAH